MATPMQIGLRVEHNDEKYKIINHEKPYANFARHYIMNMFQNVTISGGNLTFNSPTTVIHDKVFDIMFDNSAPPSC